MRLADAIRARGRGLGRLSLLVVPVGMIGQVVSFLQQATHLFAPVAGERPGVVAVLVSVTVLGVAGVGCGLLAAATPDGRRTGALGAALGGATLILFLVASTFLWRSLAIF
ncbi:hypothetical protein [Agrococcus sp. SGAir0287]|uniref:hypothetical protein n=1 Tax=Agrococcus sp. SGAir0287 TaxID=2070347 RepID=UPI0010CD28C2|nr:hypothetical protein [Agrococcus sp. SGAir0287]QCR18494.1 hypothetical protein C1N71_02700 [Agrococcus sp. SGAir0287]